MADDRPLDARSDNLKLRDDLDRFLQSRDIHEARDVVRDAPSLIGPAVASYLGEAAKRLRQLGHRQQAEACEWRLSMLRTFREYGVEEGYLELVVERLSRARGADEHRRILNSCPEMKHDATAEYLKRRFHEAANAGDVSAAGAYKFAATISRATITEVDGSAGLDEAKAAEAMGSFSELFLRRWDAAVGRDLLERRPDLLKPPLSVILRGMFEPLIDGARAVNDFVTLRDLSLRRALFDRCQNVGVALAFEELEKGVRWTELSRTN